VPEVHGLYRLGRKDLHKAGSVLAEAFMYDLDTMAVIPEEGRRKEGLHHIFKVFVRMGVLYGEVYAPSEKLGGVSIWMRSEDVDLGIIRSMRAGFLGLVLKLDGKALNTFSQNGKDVDAAHNEAITERHWYLNVIGVHPDHQRKGYGRMMIERMLKRIDSEGLPTYLDTNSAKNITIYRKFGFEVVKEYETIGNTHWGMIRPSG
jgi:ribosomal protein S18 acetylase RimI-like enzyme